MEEVRHDASYERECVDTMRWTAMSVEEDDRLQREHATNDRRYGEHPSIMIHELVFLFADAV